MITIKPLVCFDMDNTILKSDKVHIKAFNIAFQKNNLQKVPTNILAKELYGTLAKEIVKKIYPELSQSTIRKIVDDHDNIVARETYIYAKKINGVIKALKKIKKNYTIALISNCKTKEIKPILKGAKIDHKIFSKLIGQDKVKHSKPYPDMIFKAEKLTHHKAAFVVGDSIYDVKAGKKAKIKTIAVTTGHNTKKELSNADAVVKDISKVPKAIESILKVENKK